VGWLRRRLDAKVTPSVYEPWDTRGLLDAVRRSIRELERVQTRTYEESLRLSLAKEGIYLLEYGDLTPEERQWADRWVARGVFPVLTPLAVDPGHRFPFISNLSENIAVLVTEADHAEPLFARVKVPDVLPQWVRINPESQDPLARVGRGRFVAL